MGSAIPAGISLPSGAVFLKEPSVAGAGAIFDAALTSILWPQLWGRGGFLSEKRCLS